MVSGGLCHRQVCIGLRPESQGSGRIDSSAKVRGRSPIRYIELWTLRLLHVLGGLVPGTCDRSLAV